nr:MAG TPA: hypothetical protein [Caudoviricetes sp.]
MRNTIVKKYWFIDCFFICFGTPRDLKSIRYNKAS